MKAEGTAADADAQHVLAECMNSPVLSTLTLKVDEGWEYVPSSNDCGHVIGSVPKSVAFACKNVGDLEDICADEGVSRASRVFRSGSGDHKLRGNAPGPTKIDQARRRLQSTVSEAGRAHEVAALVAGLEALGCENTLGDGQTLCVMSDSYDQGGNAASLQASGDLPPVVENVKDISSDVLVAKDEGSAMMELAYDIAPNAIYKFNTAFISLDIFAADIGVLAANEGCDVIVDDIRWFTSPAFRDGPISVAVDDAVDTHDILFFTAAGNDGLALDFPSSMECTTVTTTGITGSCTSDDLEPVYTNVFDDTRSDVFRYLIGVTASADSARVIMSWDEDDGAARNIILSLWVYDGIAFELVILSDSIADGTATEMLEVPVSGAGSQYYVAVHQMGDPAVEPDVEMQLVGVATTIVGAADSAIYGQACAAKATTVGAINWDQASGTDGAFADPETSPVEDFSSRGGCSVRTNGVFEERSKPVTTAADSLSTSTTGFADFNGTSAAAPVAAAIATLIRAACAPQRVVGHDDMMAMLTDYDYIIDYTSDTGGLEAYGPEAGYGIMSASKMLAWVSANCASACPGGTGGGTDAPTATPSPVTGGIRMSPAPTAPPPISIDDGGLVEAGTKTTVTVLATGFDERPGAENGDIGCGADGCMPELARDGVIDVEESRWSCQENIVESGKDNCEIKFVFEEAQDIKQLQVAFFRGETHSRKLMLSVNGDVVYTLESCDTSGYTTYDIEEDEVKKLILESIGLDKDEWINLLEVRFLVAP